jgi:hypothetical protein
MSQAKWRQVILSTWHFVTIILSVMFLGGMVPRCMCVIILGVIFLFGILLSVSILGIIMMNVILLNVIMLRVVAPAKCLFKYSA